MLILHHCRKRRVRRIRPRCLVCVRRKKVKNKKKNKKVKKKKKRKKERKKKERKRKN
jgi:hypothetical protein